ncbi:membrane protein [Flavobacterium antarcticum]|uniref:membrane protein n=1 Tax=Flavobacterium antarcticum TaxID=271155 RepID=UPI0003B784DB|nr:membrane protein [Flavobacterium antarcticum]
MKKVILFLLLFIGQNNFAQQLSLKINGTSKIESTTIDSVGYQKKHSNAKNILEEVQQFSNKLLQIGYLEHELVDSKKINDSLYQYNFNLGIQTKLIHIYVGKTFTYLLFKKDTLILPIHKTELFLQQKLAELESKGYSLATLQLTDFKKSNNQLFATLKIDAKEKRILNEIVINGYDKFPEGHKKNLQRLYRKKTFNKSNLNKVYTDFSNFRFTTQTRYPEILFTKDSTKVYVYLEKAKANRFDGYIGFANDEESKLKFTGYLDLSLINVLNSGEEFSLYWKSDDNKQVTFNAGIEIPYVFKTPLGIKANLNIFKQDSLFQNTKTAIDLGYYFNYNKKLFIGYQSTESSDIQNTANLLISDYESKFVTTTFEYKNYTDERLFPQKTKFIFKTGFGSRTSKLETNSQTFFELNMSHDLYLNKRNVVNLRSENFYLSSSNFITNELYRFGGIQSIRGFAENSLQANTMASLMTEYRFILSSNLYMHSVLDYGFYKDDTNSTTNNLLGLGFGVGIGSKNGLLNLIYANGSINQQAIKLANSVVQIKFITKF